MSELHRLVPLAKFQDRARAEIVHSLERGLRGKGPVWTIQHGVIPKVYGRGSDIFLGVFNQLNARAGTWR